MKKISVFEVYDAENDTPINNTNRFDDGGEATIFATDTGKGYTGVMVNVKAQGINATYEIGDIDNAEFSIINHIITNSTTGQQVIDSMTRKGYKS